MTFPQYQRNIRFVVRRKFDQDDLEMLSYYSGLGRDVKLLITGETLLYFQIGIVQLIYPIYLAKLGLDGIQIGLIITAGQLTSALMALPFGMMADRYGKRLFVLIGAVLCGVAFLVIPVLSSFVHLLVTSLVVGIGMGMFLSSSIAWMLDLTSLGNRRIAFSLSAACISVGFIVSSIIGWIPPLLRGQFGYGELASYGPVVGLPGVCALLAVPIFLVAKKDTVSATRRSFFPRKSMPIIVRIGAVNAIVGLGAGFIIPLFSYWFYMRFGVDEAVLAPLYMIANGMLVISFLLAPRLADMFGTIRTIVYSQVAATGLLILIPLIESYVIVGFIYVIRGLLMNMVGPLIDSFVLGLGDSEERATLSGVMAVSWNAPNSATPTFGGYLMQNVSLSAPFYLCGILYSSAILLFYIFFHGHERRFHSVHASRDVSHV